MSLRFIDNDWHTVFQEAFQHASNEVSIISPFITLSPLQDLFGDRRLSTKVTTRFDLRGFYQNVSEIDALQFLLDNGSQIKGVRNLHAKVYIFDINQAIVTSANLTSAAMHRNCEYGVLTTDSDSISELRYYFNQLWGKAGTVLNDSTLNKWRKEINQIYNKGGIHLSNKRLKDYGKNLGYTQIDPPEHTSLSSRVQYLLKFFGTSDDRASRDVPIMELLKDSGGHWACTYPKDKRPRRVKEGAILFMGWLTKEPNDILIFGRAVGRRYEQGRDDATRMDIQARKWKQKWPHYIRVYDPEFLAGSLDNGISLYSLMSRFEHNSFTSTQLHHANQSGNINPRVAYMHQADVQLTGEAAAWLINEFEKRSRKHGQISPFHLKRLDWPEE